MNFPRTSITSPKVNSASRRHEDQDGINFRRLLKMIEFEVLKLIMIKQISVQGVNTTCAEFRNFQLG